jgi:hypothetical protein
LFGELGHLKVAATGRLAGDLLEFELAIEGFEDPGLESVAVAGFYFAKEETQA